LALGILSAHLILFRILNEPALQPAPIHDPIRPLQSAVQRLLFKIPASRPMQDRHNAISMKIGQSPALPCVSRVLNLIMTLRSPPERLEILSHSSLKGSASSASTVSVIHPVDHQQ
jgi:hypothetical protein